jgi:hypothetical protein
VDKRIRRHFGHEIVIAKYGDDEGYAYNYSVECVECYEVIIDEEAWEQTND